MTRRPFEAAAGWRSVLLADAFTSGGVGSVTALRGIEKGTPSQERVRAFARGTPQRAFRSLGDTRAQTLGAVIVIVACELPAQPPDAAGLAMFVWGVFSARCAPGWMPDLHPGEGQRNGRRYSIVRLQMCCGTGR